MSVIQDHTKFIKVFSGLFIFASLLFIIVGIAMLFFDTRYLQGTQYLFTAGIFMIILRMVNQQKIIIKNYARLSSGFVFTSIGLSINPGIWALGIILLLSGIWKKK